MSNTSRSRRLIFALFTLVLGTMAGIVLVEVGLRWSSFPEQSFRVDVVKRAADSRIRDHSRMAVKPPGTFRVLALGDSFTWGWCVHPGDTYPARLERHLGRHLKDRPVEVLNAGRQSWNTLQERRFFDRGESADLSGSIRPTKQSHLTAIQN